MHPSLIQLEPHERVIRHIRRHWFLLVVHYLFLFCAALVPLFLYMVAQNILSPSTQRILAPYEGFGHLLYSIWLLFLWMSAFSIWTDYYLDTWVITTHRLISTNQHTFFSRTTSSFRFERLQDISVTISGIIPTLLQFGTVAIQTAGETSKFKARYMPHPEDIKATIIRECDTLITHSRPPTEATQ